MNQTSPAQQPTWKVTGQQETNRADAAGRFVSGVLVLYTILATGTQGSVFVPDAQYTPGMVRELINARVTQHTSVAGLTG